MEQIANYWLTPSPFALEMEEVEPADNRAERILRPAVIARKASHGSKSRRGADAFAAFVGIARTARKTTRRTTSQAFQKLFASPAAAPAR